MDKYEITQQLLQLENRDVVRKWFHTIHNRELSLSRAQEINSAARQSGEYFRNAALSNYIVRPLLTFYGINSLSRAVVLLLRASGGENTLKGGHGLAIKNWNNILFSDDISVSLKNLGMLEVESCRGLFSELIDATHNIVSIHSYSSSVDWSIPYDIPSIGMRLSLNDLFARIPDFGYELENINVAKKYSRVSEISYSLSAGFKCKVASANNAVEESLSRNGYSITKGDEGCTIQCDRITFESNLPLFLHEYIHKDFGTIPRLYIVEPFDGNINLSEIGVTYIISYCLGMLVRYYPTHWNALVSGSNGDIYWPILNRAQHYAENVFPELIIELLNYILKGKG